MALPVVDLPDAWAVALSTGVWVGLSFGVGYVTHRAPVARFDHDTWLTRLRPIEADGRVYERRLRIRRWKGRLPEGGDTFDGGFDKRRLRGRSTDLLERFAAETRRAEMTHWVLLVCGPLFVVWNRPLVAAGMVAFGVLFNAPFIVTQRYNRARLARLLARRRAAVPA